MNLFLYLSHISLGTISLKKFKSGGFRTKMNGMEGGGCGGGGVAIYSQYQSPPSAGGQLLVPKFEKGGRVRKEMNYRF